MESFDQSLKYLLQHQPADFIRFGLGDPDTQVIASLASGLPSRGRDVDGSYLIVHRGARLVAHLEFHRRHQSLDELAIDVAEAQIRLFRRERLPVLSQVWDLYGNKDEAILEERTLPFGTQLASTRSHCAYVRVNLRGLAADDFFARAPAALWPLVPLTRDGAGDRAVRKARDAIEGRHDLGPAEQADHLAVLWFIAEAENVSTQLMKAYITEQRLMASTLYQSIFEKGVAKGVEKGEARGETRGKVDTIIRILTHRMGALDPAVRERIRSLADIETLTAWYEEALLVVDADQARRLADKIQKTAA